MTEVMSRSTKDWVSVAPLALLFLASDAGASPSAAAPPMGSKMTRQRHVDGKPHPSFSSPAVAIGHSTLSATDAPHSVSDSRQSYA